MPRAGEYIGRGGRSRILPFEVALIAWSQCGTENDANAKFAPVRSAG
jgi:hypothetical protein